MLFQYVEDGERHAVSLSDINDYLREVTGADFTAKDDRTWAGSVAALASLRALPCENPSEVRRQVAATVKDVSRLLRNTPAVYRRCYVHPAVIEAFEAGQLGTLPAPSRRAGLRVDEAVFVTFLAQLARAAQRQHRSNQRNAGQAAEALDEAGLSQRLEASLCRARRRGSSAGKLDSSG